MTTVASLTGEDCLAPGLGAGGPRGREPCLTTARPRALGQCRETVWLDSRWKITES